MNDGRLNTADYDNPNNLTNRQNQAELILQVNDRNAGIKGTEYNSRKEALYSEDTKEKKEKRRRKGGEKKKKRKRKRKRKEKKRKRKRKRQRKKHQFSPL